MIKTNIGLRIQFVHVKPFYTKCYLVDENDIKIAVGNAFCHSADQFCKSVGRKIALTRALTRTMLSKEERALVWQAYFARKGENPSYD